MRYQTLVIQLKLYSSLVFSLVLIVPWRTARMAMQLPQKEGLRKGFSSGGLLSQFWPDGFSKLQCGSFFLSGWSWFFFIQVLPWKEDFWNGSMPQTHHFMGLLVCTSTALIIFMFIHILMTDTSLCAFKFQEVFFGCLVPMSSFLRYSQPYIRWPSLQKTKSMSWFTYHIIIQKFEVPSSISIQCIQWWFFLCACFIIDHDQSFCYCNFRTKKSKFMRFRLSTFPAIVSGPFGVVSAAELIGILIFAAYIVWASYGYTIQNRHYAATLPVSTSERR